MAYFDADPTDNVARYNLFDVADTWYNLSAPLGMLLPTSIGGMIG